MIAIKTIDELKPKLYELRNEVGGESCETGVAQMDDLYIPRKGYPLFIAGAPHHGKSLFVKWLLTEWSERHGWKHFVYMGEEGGPEELAMDLAEMHVGCAARKKNFKGEDQLHMGDNEFEMALDWVGKHFTFFDPEPFGDEFTPDLFYAQANDATYDTTVLDPWNDVSRDLRASAGREDVWLTNELKKIRQHSKTANRIDVVVNHIAKLNADATTASGKRYQKPALPQEWAGGQAWYRRAFTMLLVYRPPVGERLREDQPEIRDGETWIINQKTKPKGSGNIGTAQLYLCRNTNRFTQ